MSRIEDYTFVAKLIGQPTTTAPFQGAGTALSANGNILAVTAPGDNGFAPGCVFVFEKTQGQWLQIQKIVPTDFIGFPGIGFLTISADGYRIAFGGAGDNGGQGAAWIYRRYSRCSGFWMQEQKLVPPGTTVDSNFGTGISLDAKGKILAVGAPSDGTAGATWIFVRRCGVWTFQQRVVGSNALGPESLQGSAVSLSANGKVLAVGAFFDDSAPTFTTMVGATWVWTYDKKTGMWIERAKLLGTSPDGTVPPNANQGGAVSLSACGNFLAIGGFFDNNGIGATWIFRSHNHGVTWTQEARLVGTGGTFPSGVQFQGSSVALTYSGDTVFIGTPGSFLDAADVGGVFIFRRQRGIWIQQGAGPVAPPNQIAPSAVGDTSVSVSKEGKDWAVGGFTDNSDIGATWVYRRKASPSEECERK